MSDADVGQAVLQVAASCLSSVMRDESWQDIGFSGRPRVGSSILSFRTSWQVNLEKRVFQEMLVAFTAAHALAGRITVDEVASVVAAYTSNPELVEALGYPSRENATEHLTKSIAQYVQMPLGQWHYLLARQIKPGSIPDKALSARLQAGCIQFAENVCAMVLILRVASGKELGDASIVPAAAKESATPSSAAHDSTRDGDLGNVGRRALSSNFWSTGSKEEVAKSTTLSKFMAQAAVKPYRDLIEHHIGKQTAKEIMNGMVGEVAILSALDTDVDARAFAETFSDHLNYVLLNAKNTSPQFWSMNCRETNARDA